MTPAQYLHFPSNSLILSTIGGHFDLVFALPRSLTEDSISKE